MTTLITPVKMTDAILTNHSVAEDDYPAWVYQHYSVGDYVIRTQTHSVYRALTDHHVNTPPEDDATNWQRTGPTNRWAAFDDAVGTSTKKSGGFSFTFSPGRITGLAFLDVTANDITVSISSNGITVYEKTIDLAYRAVSSWWEYLTTEFSKKTTAAFLDLPWISAPEITVTVAGGADCAIGVCVFGARYVIGQTLRGAEAENIDYSRKVTDEFGVTTIVSRSRAKRLKIQDRVLSMKSDESMKRLSEVSSTPCVFVGSGMFDSTIIYGIPEKSSASLRFADYHYISIDILGLI